MDTTPSPELESEVFCIQPCKHHPTAPQYPNGNHVDHLAHLSDLFAKVAKAISQISFPRPYQRYSSVHVLMISWEEDDLGTADEISTLEAIFQETYRYSTHHYRIPSHRKIPVGDSPAWQLERQLMDTRIQHGTDADGLLIVYYGGHGEVDNQTQHATWKAWMRQPLNATVPRSPKLDWTELQPVIMKARGEILFILDCCYASGALENARQQQQHQPRRELLLASGTTKASNDNTLTNALIRELGQLKAMPCTVGSLHSRLLHKHRLDPIPIFTCMVGTEAGISLAPLPNPTDTGAIESSGLIVPVADRQTLHVGPRILFSVAVSELGNQSMEDTWVEWFRDHAPPNIVAVDYIGVLKPEAAFAIASFYLIFSIPVSIWNAMSPDPAIGFLAIIHSGNLLYSDTVPRTSTASQQLDLRAISHGRLSTLLGTAPLVKKAVQLSLELTRLQKEIISLKEDNQGMKERHDSERSAMRAEFTEELSTMRTKHEKDMSDVRARCDREIGRIRAGHERSLLASAATKTAEGSAGIAASQTSLVGLMQGGAAYRNQQSERTVRSLEEQQLSKIPTPIVSYGKRSSSPRSKVQRNVIYEPARTRKDQISLPRSDNRYQADEGGLSETKVGSLYERDIRRPRREYRLEDRTPDRKREEDQEKVYRDEGREEKRERRRREKEWRERDR